AGTLFEVVVVVEAILNFGAGAGGNVDESDVRGRTADGAFHGVGGPVGGNGKRLVLERSDALVQVLAEGNERIFAEVPGSEHVFLAVVLGVEFLFGHDFDVAPVPNVHGGLLVFVLVLVFGGTGVFCGGIVGLGSISGLGCVRSGSCRFCEFADFEIGRASCRRRVLLSWVGV